VRTIFVAIPLFIFAPTFPHQVKAQSANTGPITTYGQCSAVDINAKAPVTITCDSKGMSAAESKKQAEAYAKILSVVRKNGLDTEEVLQKLDSMIKAATVGRHLTTEQRASLIAALQPFAGSALPLQSQEGNAEAAGFADDFFAIFNSAHLIGNEGSYASFSRVPPLGGLTLLVPLGTNRVDQLPNQCQVLYAKLKSFQIAGFRRRQDPTIHENSCTLAVGNRGTPHETEIYVR